MPSDKKQIAPAQVWRYKDEREDRNVVVDFIDGDQTFGNPFVHVHNAKTGRRSTLRMEVFRRHYDFLPEEASRG